MRISLVLLLTFFTLNLFDSIVAVPPKNYRGCGYGYGYPYIPKKCKKKLHNICKVSQIENGSILQYKDGEIKYSSLNDIITNITMSLQNCTCPQGAKGEKGDTGPAGNSTIGPEGPQGPQGEKGDTGPAGNSTIGPEGPQGPQGEKGDTGPAGNSTIGPEGPQGPQGEKGDTGPAGNSTIGPQGPKGDDGKPFKPFKILGSGVEVFSNYHLGKLGNGNVNVDSIVVHLVYTPSTTATANISVDILNTGGSIQFTETAVISLTGQCTGPNVEASGSPSVSGPPGTLLTTCSFSITKTIAPQGRVCVRWTLQNGYVGYMESATLLKALLPP